MISILFFISFLFPFVSNAGIDGNSFCNVIDGNLCIRNKSINNIGSITSPTNLNILVNNSLLICNNSNTCFIKIANNDNYTITINNSLILAPYINISSSTNVILIASEVSANGTFGRNWGSSSNSNQGHAFLGIGAHCPVGVSYADKTYGRICENILTMSSLMNLSGSGGSNSNSYGFFFKKKEDFFYIFIRRRLC